MNAVLALLALGTGISAASTDQPGEVYTITRSYETKSTGSDGSSSESSGHTAVIERVIASDLAGIELEYDLPADADAQDRAREWQFPARVLKPANGPMQLLNREALEARIASWLKAAKLPRSACGTWYFTWNAFKVECDPTAVLATVEAYDLRSADIGEGGNYRPQGGKAGVLRLIEGGSGERRLSLTTSIDADGVRLSRAETDVVVGELMRSRLPSRPRSKGERPR